MLNYSIKQKTESDLVVSVNEAKAHCVIDYDFSDSQITNDIKAATQVLQEFTGLAFLPSTVTLQAEQKTEEGRDNYVLLPFSNNVQLPTDSKYHVFGNKLYTDDEQVSVTYDCGDTPEEWMKQAVLMYVADLYENRGNDRQSLTVGNEAKQFCKNFISHGAFF